ncbi:serine/threonine-protein kinase [Spirillospora sp. NPDC127200]
MGTRRRCAPGGIPGGVPPLLPGDPPMVGGHLLLGRLGTGGMGTVYLGRAPDGTLAAVKTLPPARARDPEARGRFRAEAAYAQRVASFCTARVLADGSDRDRPYIVTEYIDGPPLSQVVERHGALPPGGAVAVGIGVAVALAAIHGAGLVHRDLKPANVLLARSGPRVIDFGIAVEPDLAAGPTQAGVVMGSPGWIAPERLLGGPATAAADVFGWGCLVAYAATGRHPFDTGPPEGVGDRVINEQPVLEGLDDPLRTAVLTALRKDPARRPSAVELLHALLPLRAEGDPAKAIADLWEPTDYGATPVRARRGLLLKAGFAAAWATAGGAAAIWALAGADPAARAEPEPGGTKVITVGPGGDGGAEGGAPVVREDGGRSAGPAEPASSAPAPPVTTTVRVAPPPAGRPSGGARPSATPTTATPTATPRPGPSRTDRWPHKKPKRKDRPPRLFEWWTGPGTRAP